MASFMSRSNITIAVVALVLGCTAVLGIVAVPDRISFTTYAGFAALMIAAVGVALTSWKNGQGSGSVGQLLHETSLTPSASGVPSDSSAPNERR